ncbi:unnamed protein product, partial [Ectocarpus sp. 6 AP-2014]
NDPNCRKWIHKRHCRPSFNTFLEDESKRCCKHHRETVTKSKCNCCSCVAWRRKQSAPGEGRAVVRGGAAGRHGKGRGHAGRTGGRGGSKFDFERLVFAPCSRRHHFMIISKTFSAHDYFRTGYIHSLASPVSLSFIHLVGDIAEVVGAVTAGAYSSKQY